MGKLTGELQERIALKFFVSSPDPMFITRVKDGTYLAVNDSYIKHIGLNRKDLIGKTTLEMSHLTPKVRSKIVKEIKEKGCAKNVEWEGKIKNKKFVRILCNIYPLTIGKDTYILTHIMEIFESRKKQDYLFVESIFREKMKHYKLTSRQEEIALLTAAGHSNGDIADKLCISEYTVKDHCKEIFRKTGIGKRAELIPKILSWG